MATIPRYDPYFDHINFTGAGTHVINCVHDNTKLYVFFADLYANGVTLTISVGTTQITGGAITVSPVQLNFGAGRGSGINGESISITVTGACDVYLGYCEKN